ncbi:helix-turn-helix domain-containing protein [Chryseobacterium populi]|uniref:Transposase n=1 Tax=Chryseobacterium populi TaxID=1144316 RepID=J3CPC6_9FLAO|nr:helix-turn-helix domain-containing protein [Chryseobacterium populi]EJL75819.1 hypothetical protein PMI13_00215 [Chryseobacterium populi]
MKTTPDYKRIYTDLINEKYPEKKEEYLSMLPKENFSVLEVISFNQMLFSGCDQKAHDFNQKHRFYSKQAILEILDYQKKHKYNNMQLARHFNLSRNTVTRWKKLFLI